MAEEKPVKKNRNLKQDVALLSLTAICLYLLLSLVTYSKQDNGWASVGGSSEYHNAGGPVGAYLADSLLHGLGYLAYIIPLLAAGKVFQIFRSRNVTVSGSVWFLRFLGFTFCILSFAPLFDLSIFNNHSLPAGSGGMMGQGISELMVGLFSILGASIILVFILCIGLMLFWEFSWLLVFDSIGRGAMFSLTAISEYVKKTIRDRRVYKKSATAHQTREVFETGDVNQNLTSRLTRSAEPPLLTEVVPSSSDSAFNTPRAGSNNTAQTNQAVKVESEGKVDTKVVAKNSTSSQTDEIAKTKEVKIEPLEKRDSKPSERAVRDLQGKLFSEENPLPSIALLDPEDEDQGLGYSKERLEELSIMLEQKLSDFGIKAEVMAVAPGPVITRFEIQPAPGTKASKVSGIAQDLARSMAMNSVRVVEVIPGKSVMGVEIPNEHRAMVRLSSVLSSEDFDKSKSPLTIALGHDIAGNPVVTDLAKMPHLLVAGTTGSGKSVGVNAMIISLLYKSTPDEVRLIMVDPKMLELSVYEGIPHLLTPVITDMKEAANGLRWSVEEMERRYQLMAALGVRNVAGYNAKVKAAIEEDKPIPDPLWQIDQSFDTTPPTLKPLPYIVVIVDEFADMMMTVGKKVEELLARIAQKARAAGIHLILATQRPSVDVITGLIKANVPTRIAFQVSSKIDSRTILDQGGAEQLLGHGDMLFQPAGTSIPVRVHGAFVDDDEVHRVVAEWKTKGEPNYIEEITQVTEQAGLTLEGGDEKDDLYDQAVSFVTETRKVSISSVQRKFRIGYNRAARLVETMEASGVVSPAANNGSREVIAPPPVNH